jgi:glycosyltransferase involved in cell wall biosynthesis
MDTLKILYLGCHSVLEFDECKLLSDMGHTVFNMHGAYMNPLTPSDPKRPGFKADIQQHLMDVAAQCSKDNIHPELIEWADIIIVMHIDRWIISNWKEIRKKIVIWRTIGQSVPEIENRIAYFKNDGLRIVRYSPKEQTIEGYAGHDAIIRFYKDEGEFHNWNGQKEEVITVGQSMKKRGTYCNYETFNRATIELPRRVYGPGNEDIDCTGGQLTYDELKRVYADNRVYFYTGTYPASYTLNFIEAMMTGIPMVCIGNDFANIADFKMNAYEIPDIIQNGVNGYVSNDIEELRTYVKDLLAHHDLASEIGAKGREKAIELFGKSTVVKQWEEYLNSL